MTMIKTRIRIAPDGTLSGRARGLPAGEHDAEIIVRDTAARPSQGGAGLLLARVRAIQAELAQLPVLDARNPDDILGFNQRGHFG